VPGVSDAFVEISLPFKTIQSMEKEVKAGLEATAAELIDMYKKRISMLEDEQS